MNEVPEDWTAGGCDSCQWHLDNYDRSDLRLFWHALRQKNCVNPTYEALEKRQKERKKGNA